MTWTGKVWRWGSLAISVAALSGIALSGMHWAEQHALEAVLGQGARSDSLSIHWAYSAGCAENVSIPLARAKQPQGDAAVDSRLSARRMWFTYDLNALLRKRVVLPRIVIEDAHIVAASSPKDRQQPASAIRSTVEEEARQWIEQLHDQIAALETEQFVAGTQVAIDTAMLAEQWQANFVDVHNRAQRILVEAKDIQQELAALDNPLRHEPQVVASRGRLEVLKAELAGLKNSLLKTDKTLREQQSRIREALLTEKKALRQTGSDFRSPPADGLAELTVDRWLESCLKEPTQYSLLLAELICTPFRQGDPARGSNVRHVDAMTAQFAVGAAKIAGDISLPGQDNVPSQRAPFTASGSFEVRPSTDVYAGERPGEGARWQMSVGRTLNCISLEGESRSARSGTAQIKFQCSGPGQVEAKCNVTGSTAAGTGKVRLREWIGERSHLAAVNHAASGEPLARMLLDEALCQLEPVPQEMEFDFATRGGRTEVKLDEQDVQWLAGELAQAASAHVTQKYEAAAEKLETRVLSELEAMNRAVAVSYNQESQHLQQLLQEMKVLQADVMNNLAQRAGTEFARKSAGDTLR